MANHIPTKTSFKNGHKRSIESRLKQAKTMHGRVNRLAIERMNTPEANAKKIFRKPRICQHCKGEYIAKFANQKWCYDCSPNKSSRAIMQRYDLSVKDHQMLKDKFNGLCWICRRRTGKVVDHCHRTGKVRGILCHHCNTAIALIEDIESLKRAIEYLEIKL